MSPSLGSRSTIPRRVDPAALATRLPGAQVGAGYRNPPSAGPWTSIATLPSEITDGGTPAFVFGNGARIFVVGHDGVDPTCDEYSPGGDSFSPVSGPPFHLDPANVWRAYDSTTGLLIVGSRNADDSTDHVMSYDIGSDTWTDGLTLPSTVRGHAAAAAVGGFVYLAGGDVLPPPAPPTYDTVEAYDISGDSWSTLGNLPAELSSWRADAATDGLVYATGARQDNRLYSYDPGTDTWTVLDSGVWNGVAEVVAVSNGDLLIGGGAEVPNVPASKRFSIYRPSSALYDDPAVDSSPQPGVQSGASIGMTAYMWNMFDNTFAHPYEGGKITLHL